MKWCLGLLTLGCLQLSAVIPEKVVICTIFRDAGAYLPETMSHLESIGALFQDYRIIAYENNSEDDTPSQLYRWKRENPKVSVTVDFLSRRDFEKTLINCANGKISQTEQRARARNKVLAAALSQVGEDFSYLIWIDADVQLESLEEITPIFEKNRSWDAVFAYGVDREGNFRDWEAFRDPLTPFGPELVGDAWYTEAKQFSLSKDDPWYPVYSAFGGCGIYKRSLFQNCKYEGVVSPSLESATRKWLLQGRTQQRPCVARYLQELEKTRNFVYIDFPRVNLPKLSKESGIYISRGSSPLVWKIHGPSQQYPEVCEQVSLHASMFCRGYSRFFIDPRLICVGKDNRCASHPN